MDSTMEISAVKLPTHEHPLYPSSRYLPDALCEVCGIRGHIYGGYRCNESECYNNGIDKGAWFHKQCAESPPEINHPSHPEHPLIFTKTSLEIDPSDYKPCNLCGNKISNCYWCATCGVGMCMGCAQKPPPPPAIEHPMFHEHPLVRTKSETLMYCKICKNYVDRGCPYECLACKEVFHLECVNQPKEVNHSSHSNHILEFYTSESLSENAEKTCLLCGIESEHVLCHCSTCNFSICIYCTRNPPPLTIEHTKTHKHKLSLLSRRVSFTCNVCGLQGDRSPYSCIQCSFLVHRHCIDLPRVININRHDHRISLTDHIGHGNLKCGVCHKSANQYYGGYTCSSCPNFVVHSSCPTKYRVWDGVELEGIPEEDDEDIAPFEVVGDGLIKHFSHENHIIRLEDHGTTRDEDIRCEACVTPVYSDPVYSCEQCDYILHETCANLPRRKRLPFHNLQFKLYAPNMDSAKTFTCLACFTMFSGFRYVADGFSIDVRCGTFSELVSYDFHDHPLYYGNNYDDGNCGACQGQCLTSPKLCCDDCDFVVDFRCLNLPKVVKHKHDERPLSLCYGEYPNGKYWCDICEGETNPKDWFYTCFHSGVTLHVQCVLGDFSFLMPRSIMKHTGSKFEVVPNTHCSRPFCAVCQSRCIGPFFLRTYNPEIIYVCSARCLLFKVLLPGHRECF